MNFRVIKHLYNVALQGDSNDLIFRQNGRVLGELQVIYIWMAKFENFCHIPYVLQMAVISKEYVVKLGLCCKHLLKPYSVELTMERMDRK